MRTGLGPAWARSWGVEDTRPLLTVSMLGLNLAAPTALGTAAAPSPMKLLHIAPVSNLSECQRTRNASLCSLLEVKLTQHKLTHSHWFIWWQLVQSQHWAMAAFINPSHCHQLEGGASRTSCFPFL